MLKSRIEGLIWFILISFAYIYSDSYFALFLFIMSLVILLFLGISTKIVKNKVKISLKVPDTINKDTLGDCYLEAKNTSFLPISKVKCRLSFKNLMTGEEGKEEVYFSINGKANENIHWHIRSEFCGDIEVKVEEVVYYDYLGVFSTSNNILSHNNIIVLPDMFYINIELLESTVENSESIFYSISQKGTDSSEIFGIKEYTPEDNLKNIHWKLTSKFDELIVKELSTPIDNSILVLLETSTPVGKGRELPKTLDAMIETFVSLSKSLLENDRIHSVGWFDPEVEGLLIAEIYTVDDLSNLLRGLLKIERKENQYSCMDYYINMEKDSVFSHIVYITSQYSEGVVKELANESQLTVLQCEDTQKREKVTENTSVFTFTPESMEEDLRQLMI